MAVLWVPSTMVDAAIQRYPAQWWWDALLRFRNESRTRELGHGQVDPNGYKDAIASLGVHGSIVHPNVLRFNLTTDLSLSQSEPSGRKSKNYGLGGGFELFPAGKYRMNFSFRKSFFDFDTQSSELRFSARPESGTVLGGGFRVQSGWFGSIAASFSSTTFRLDDAGDTEDSTDSQTFYWGKRAGRLNHQMRIHRSVIVRGITGIEQEDVRLRLDEKADLGEHWKWRLNGDVSKNSSVVGTRQPFEARSSILGNSLYRTFGNVSTLSLDNTLHFLAVDASPDSTATQTSINYTWKAPRALHIGASLWYDTRKSGTNDSRQPAVALTLYKTWNHGRYRSNANATVSRALTREINVDSLTESTRTGYTGSYQVNHTAVSGANKFLQLRHAVNDFRLEGSQGSGLPDPEFTLSSLGSTDSSEARVGIKHFVGRYPASVWGRWTRSNSSSALDSSVKLQSTVYSLSAQLNASSISYNLTSDHRVQEDPSTSGNRSFLAHRGSISWRPTTFLSFWGLYQRQESKQLLIPRVNGDSTELGTTLNLSTVRLELKWWSRHNRVDNMTEQTEKGVSWSIISQFSGWLPYSSGPKKNGFIR